MKKRSASPNHPAGPAAKAPHARRRAHSGADEMNQATTDEFEREEMGIAAKE